MRIRRFHPEDLQQAAPLFCSIFNGEPWHDEWEESVAEAFLRDIVETPGFLGFAAENEGGLAGLVMGHRKRWWRGDIYFINEMGVARDKQGQGIGRKLLEYAVQEAKREGMQNISLLTERHYDAYAFYRKLGFKEGKNTRLMYRFLR